MKNIFILSILMLGFITLNAQIANNKQTAKLSSDPSKKMDYVKINAEESPITVNMDRSLIFLKEGGFSAKYFVTSLEINNKMIQLLSDTLSLDPNKHFEFLTKDFGKFYIMIKQSSNLNEGVIIGLWVPKNQEQNILKK